MKKINKKVIWNILNGSVLVSTLAIPTTALILGVTDDQAAVNALNSKKEKYEYMDTFKNIPEPTNLYVAAEANAWAEDVKKITVGLITDAQTTADGFLYGITDGFNNITINGNLNSSNNNNAIFNIVENLNKINNKTKTINANIEATPVPSNLMSMESGKIWLIAAGIISLAVLVLYIKMVYTPYVRRRNHAELLAATERNNGSTTSNITDEHLIKTMRIKALEVKVNNKTITDKEVKELEKLLK